MYTPDLSIILPVFNGATYLANAVNSVLNQSINSWELILVNDGSTDNTDIICRQFSLCDKRIHYFSQNNRGLSAARNAGFFYASGHYIVYLDADDYVEPDYYKKLIEVAENSGANFIVTGFTREFYNRNKKTHTSIIKFSDQVLQTPQEVQTACQSIFFYNIYIHVWNKLYRHDFLLNHKILFDETLRYGEDVPYNIEVLKKINTIFFSNLTGYHYICHNSARLTNNWRESLLNDNGRIYTQITNYEKKFWNVDSSTVASGMYLRGCFLSIEKALNSKLSYDNILKQINNILTLDETKIALSVISQNKVNKEFSLYCKILSSTSLKYIYIATVVRKLFKIIMGR